MLTVTDIATQKLNEIMAQQPEPVAGLRVHVFPGGCSGWSYGMSLAKEAEAGDWVGEFGGIKVLVDPQSAPMLDGARIDYLDTLQASGFTISNPNAARSCGCGKSFHTDEAAEAGADTHAHGGGGCGCGSGGGGCGCGGH